MSKSFDEKIRNRLSSLEKAPPTNAKASVLGQVLVIEGQTLGYFYDSLAAILILLCFFQIGKRDNEFQTNSLKNKTAHSELVRSNDFDKRLDNKTTEIIESSKKVEFEKVKTKQVIQLDENVNHTNSTIDVERFVSAAHELEREALETIKFHLLNKEFSNLPNLVGLKAKVTNKIIFPKKDKKVYPYINTGAFFMYNRVKPNLNDDIYVGEYDAPFGVSPARIGLALEGGIHKRWNNLFASRLGLSFNNFNQSFSFTVRNFKPDSVSVNTEDGLLESHFDKENVRVNKRISVIGLKGQAFFYIFPNQANVLFASMEYQYLISSPPTFNYLDKKYSLMNPSQYLTEIGIRKLLFERHASEIFLMPSIRYSVNKFTSKDIITVKPFSVGVTLSYQMK